MSYCCALFAMGTLYHSYNTKQSRFPKRRKSTGTIVQSLFVSLLSIKRKNAIWKLMLPINESLSDLLNYLPNIKVARIEMRMT